MINADIYAKYNLSKKSSIEISARKSITDFVETPTYKEYFNKVFQNTTITDFSEKQKPLKERTRMVRICQYFDKLNGLSGL